MTTFIHPYHLPVGDFPFGTCFDGIALTPSSSGCLTTLPPYRISTDSPASRGNMAFQPAMNQVADASFFDETISTSSMSTQVDFCFPPFSPQQVTEAKIPEDPKPLKAVLLTVEVSAKLEDDVSEPTADESKRKKRDRKPKGARKGPSKAPRLEDSDGEAHPRDPRRRRILERNRIAATKCRLRKRDEVSALASREQAMEDQNRDSSSIFDQLTAEIYHLKTQLLRHTDCSCVLIQKYIAHEARKSVDGLPPCPSPFQANVAPLIGYQRGSSRSVASAIDSHGIRTPEMESVPPIWTDPSQQDSGSPEVGVDIFDMALEPIQKEPIPESCQPISSIPSMHVCCYQGTCVDTGPQLQPSDGVLWGLQWEF
ncbi:hypothetical protein BGZ61DRAFT_497839 [Ilyonectria robusta]|uniref:uncharacterized protein n=1 Tax=Ilyonectria robusta TaxID=1079257 RepID=UPI001E8EC2B5|nr:uncharacterized protein BGZ61DRAFT_497839 [Ilyonectria robusta]KAH8670755.1 hypothetical protein BGZ61DRAFT_497839 [Ilyonectria robusta]